MNLRYDVSMLATNLVLSALIAAAAMACSSKPDQMALYAGISHERMSRLVPGTGEHAKANRYSNLEAATVDIIDPTTDQALIRLESADVFWSSGGHHLYRVNVGTQDAPPAVGRETLLTTLGRFIAHGWRCELNDTATGNAQPASATVVPEGLCVTHDDERSKWSCRPPLGWPRGHALFTPVCSRSEDGVRLMRWNVEMSAPEDPTF